MEKRRLRKFRDGVLEVFGTPGVCPELLVPEGRRGVSEIFGTASRKFSERRLRNFRNGVSEIFGALERHRERPPFLGAPNDVAEIFGAASPKFSGRRLRNFRNA